MIYSGKRKINNELTDNTMDIIYGRKDLSKCLNQIKSYSADVYNHSIRVAFLSAQIGENIGVCNLENLFIAGLFHDYGKVFISKQIIEKPGPLTFEEREVMKMHSFLGPSELKKNTSLSADILDGILDHHERIDGSGYGNYKTEHSISHFGKIIALADVYDAMVSKRIYRERIDTEVVRVYIKSNAGKLFNFDLTNVLMECVDFYKQ